MTTAHPTHSAARQLHCVTLVCANRGTAEARRLRQASQMTQSGKSAMTITPDERRQANERLAEVRAKIRAIEEQIDLPEWKRLYNEMLRLQRRLQQPEAK